MNLSAMTKEKHLALGLFLINFLIGLSFINAGLFHMDSVMLATAVEKTYQTGILQPAVHGRYGAVFINCILYFPFYLLGQNADFVTRFSSVLFHAFSAVAFFYFVRGVFADRAQAFNGALLFSLTPLYFIPDTYGKEHGMSIFFLLLAFLLLDSAIKKGSPILILFASTCYVFSITVRESLIWTVPLFALFFINPEIFWRPFKASITPERFRTPLLFAFIFPQAVFFSIVLSTYLVNVIQLEYVNGILLPTFPHAIKDLMTSTPWPILPLLAIGIWGMARYEKPFTVIFFLFWLMMILLYGNTNWYTPRHLDIVIIPLNIFVSYALGRLYLRFKTIANIAVIYCVIAMLLFMYPMLEFRHDYNGEKEFALFVKSKTEANAVIATTDQFAFIEYYGKRRTLFLPLTGPKDAIKNFINTTNEYLADGVPVYYTNASFVEKYEQFSDYVVTRRYNISYIGQHLREDYHRPELDFRLSYQKLYKVTRR